MTKMVALRLIVKNTSINKINKGCVRSVKKLIAHCKQYRFLLGELVKKGITLRYRRSFLGVFWTMLEPLLTMIVLTFIFGPLLGYSSDKTYPVYILSGRLIYTMFSQSTKECTRAIRSNAAMIKKVYVPKYLFPLSHVIFNYIIFAISLIVLAIVSLILGVIPTWWLFTAIVPLINVFLLSLAVGMLLATIGVFFRDMEYLWIVALTLIMYMSAIFYNINEGKYSSIAILKLLKFNPLYCVIENFRGAIFSNTAACPFSWNLAVYTAVFSLVLLAFSAWLFHKKQDEFIMHI